MHIFKQVAPLLQPPGGKGDIGGLGAPFPPVMPEDRKCLGVLQPNMQKQTRLSVTPNGNLQINPSSRGKKRKSNENLHSTKKRRDGIFEDPVSVKKQKIEKNLTSVEVQTDSTTSSQSSSSSPSSQSSSQASTVIDMLTSDTPTPEYWMGLAEKRREALDEALQENEKLHTENKNLKAEVSELKQENKLLEEMVDEAKQLALLVQNVVQEDEEEVGSTNDDKNDASAEKTD